MPHHRCDTHEDPEIRDHEATDLPGVDAAQAEAMRFVGDLFISEGRRPASNAGCRLVVDDEHDIARFRLDATVSLASSFHPER